MKLKNHKLKEKLSPFLMVSLIVLLLYVFSLFLPLFWALITSFKDQTDFRINVVGLPEKFVWNYTYVFKHFFVQISTENGPEKVWMEMLLLNSFLYAVGCAFFNALVPCVAAYACARFPYKFSNVVCNIIIIVMVVPIVGSLPAEIQMARNFGLYDQIWGLWIMKANFLGMYFLVYYGTFKAFPMSYSEAAKIDGAGNLTIMVKIILPLIRTTFFTIFLIYFISYWNDYQTPLIYMPSYPTLALGMYRMATTTENDLATLPMRMTAAMILLIPILILYSIFNQKLLGNLTMGGIKG